MATAKKLIVGNWKMKPATFKEARQILSKIEKGFAARRTVSVVLCPPQPFLGLLKKEARSRAIGWGGQDCFFSDAASQTGESSPTMLASLGARWVILGHSERRTRGEASGEVAKKVKAALSAGLTPIVCFGEAERDRAGAYVTFLQAQLADSLAGLTKDELGKVVIAYEPLWAIGKSAAESTVTPTQVHEMVIFVRKFLAKKVGRAAAEQVPVLYGGSVEPGNAEPLLYDGHASGLLVGHASLVPAEFLAIVEIAKR
ncbi:triose-phosphate isomerase [Patescibacteria group bacterium]|jgi:triosephosphate isomerase|nr:triose-phosphate isomerase [Patescibacteria group bacterium]